MRQNPQEKKYKVCVAPFANNIGLEYDFTEDARKWVLAGLKSNPQNADVAFTDSIAPDCQAIVYGVITYLRTIKIDAQDVVVSYRLSINVINPATNAIIDSFTEYSDNPIENSARILKIFPASEDIPTEIVSKESEESEQENTEEDFSDKKTEPEESALQKGEP